MTSLMMIVLTAAVISNLVLNQCSLQGDSGQIETAGSLGAAVVFVITIASGFANALNTFVLCPLGLEYLQIFVMILLIAILMQVVVIFIQKSVPVLHSAQDVYLPLITISSVVLGVALSSVTAEYGFSESVMAGFGTAAGYALTIILMAGVREQVDNNENIPASFKGAPVVLLIAALMAIAFSGLGNFGI